MSGLFGCYSGIKVSLELMRIVYTKFLIVQ